MATIIKSIYYPSLAADGHGLFKPIMTALNFTNRCNARCEMCLEKGNEKQFQPYSLEEAVGILRQISKLSPGTAKSYLHLWGGEPFLDFELLKGIVKEADKLGFKYIEIATNGFWGKDINEARAILTELLKQTGTSRLALQLSCDNFHQSQPILSPQYLANILSLAIIEFPAIRVSFNTLILSNYVSLHDVSKAVSSVDLKQDIKAFFDDQEYYSIFFMQGNQGTKIEISFFPVSLSGRCTSRLKEQFGNNPYKPEQIAGINYSTEHHLSIGIDRQLYISLQFSSPEILPIGSIREYPLKDLIERVEADPIAVSLMTHGYSEIYPHLKELFDFDSWIGQFHSAYDVLQGLEVD